jgi:tRNA nucleotidyltransferase (CCA-adding enzyme)
MSDYMFMLESHLSSEQSRVVSDVQAAAAQANMNVFLTGGAMRDMLGGFPIVEIDFTVEGNAVKLAQTVAKKIGGKVAWFDDNRKVAQLVSPSGVHATLGMARQEKYPKPGAKPVVRPATIHEDLRGRDFTINSIALSLNPASRGLLLDPNNGVGDLERKELRAVSNYTLYDDPIRLLRLLRFKVRLTFNIDERTKMQYDNAREAQLETRISREELLEELRHIANEPNCADVIRLLEEEKLLELFSPALTSARLNHPGLQKLQKARQLVPFGAGLHHENMGLFLYFLAEKLSVKERGAFIKSSGITRRDVEHWQKIEPKSKKLEKELKSAKLQKPSHIYQVLSKAPGDQILFLLAHSSERLVHDRIKNYFQKYLPTSQEVTEKDVLATGARPGTPKFQKAREELILTRLDARPKKILPVDVPPSGGPPGSQHGAPQGPRGPGSQHGPPQGPRGPGAPQGPRGPGAPQGPRGPGAPQGPRGPGAPQGPRGPGAPQGARGPGAPQGPRVGVARK